MKLPRLSPKNIPLLSTCAVFVLLYVVGSLAYRNFFSLRVFVNFFIGNSFLGIIAVGMTFVILSGSIDLSVGSVLALSSIVTAVLMDGPHLLVETDVREPAALAARLRAGEDPLSQYLRSRLSAETRRRLDDLAHCESAAKALACAAARRQHDSLLNALARRLAASCRAKARELRGSLAADLDRVVQGGVIHGPERFRGVVISVEAQRQLYARLKRPDMPAHSAFTPLERGEQPLGLAVIRRPPSRADRAFANHLLLREAYPGLLRDSRMRHPRLPVPVAFGVALAIGAALGFAMGCLIAHYDLPPFIVTLAGMFFARGLAQIVHLETLPIYTPFYRALTAWGIPLGGSPPVSVPVTALIFLAVLAAGIYVSGFRVFGRSVYAVGGNEEAALLMGVPVRRTRILVHTLSGLCAALAGIVFTFDGSGGSPSAAVGMELDAIAAVVVGGTLLSGGVGTVFGTLMGVLIFGIIQTGIDFHGDLSSWWKRVAIGVLLLFFILLQKLFARPAGRGS